MMSPTPAKRRFDPPSTLMHWTRLAPLLSATSRFDCIWIIDALPFQLAFRGSPGVPLIVQPAASGVRSEEHTSELQSLMRISYAVFCLKKKNNIKATTATHQHRYNTTRYNQTIV